MLLLLPPPPANSWTLLHQPLRSPGQLTSRRCYWGPLAALPWLGCWLRRTAVGAEARKEQEVSTGASMPAMPGRSFKSISGQPEQLFIHGCGCSLVAQSSELAHVVAGNAATCQGRTPPASGVMPPRPQPHLQLR